MNLLAVSARRPLDYDQVSIVAAVVFDVQRCCVDNDLTGNIAVVAYEVVNNCARSLRRCDGVDRNSVGYGHLGLLDGSHLGFLESLIL